MPKSLTFSKCLTKEALQKRSNKFINIIPRLMALGPIKVSRALREFLNSRPVFPNQRSIQQRSDGQEAEAGETNTSSSLRALSVFCTHELKTIADDVRACIGELGLYDTSISTPDEADPMQDTRSLIIFCMCYLEAFYQTVIGWRSDSKSIIQTVHKMLDELHAVLKTHLATETDDHPRNHHLSELLDLYIAKLKTYRPGSLSTPWIETLDEIVRSKVYRDQNPELCSYALPLHPKIDQSAPSVPKYGTAAAWNAFGVY